MLRRLETPLLLVANKCEGSAADAGLYEAHELGLGEPLAISAEHGIGMTDLAASLLPFDRQADEMDGEGEEEPAERVIQLAHRRAAQCRQVDPAERAGRGRAGRHRPRARRDP